MKTPSRREIILGAACSTPFASSKLAAAGLDVSRYLTPYKYGKLVLSADPSPEAFDSRFVDCPFVFYHERVLHDLHRI